MISDLKKAALSSLKGKWGLGVGTTFLYFVLPVVSMYITALVLTCMFAFSFSTIQAANFVDIIDIVDGEPKLNLTGSVSLFLGCAILILIFIALQSMFDYGYYNFTLRLAKNESTTIGNLFEGFKSKHIFRTIKLGILQTILLLLWSLLFIIPGIIKSLSYAMAFYILIEDPNCTPLEAIRRSKEMMKGHKFDLFITMLSFIGWYILGCIVGLFALFLPYLWLNPYYYTTMSHFYLNLVNRNNTGGEKTIN
ncbi:MULTISPECIES: DUF975 family protein [unclassified Bacillus (in: firmicutes)]|uniref:DUF975 family protein n=1 Tax=unclassified Bacillus (in: firmicutes) TaxID=185979 RepID=UPI0008E896E9|nr:MULTISPECIES: DUF975 family protein [unclassified Bacillus (in: firmicutes)]SFI72258.1 Uncharacterized membrane protein [Bacillus sp. 71mf]SFS88741.1 Uncharacterized membrane protein [Bacillus sp. 103mf]